MSFSKYISLNREVFLNSVKKINLSILMIALIDYIFYSFAYLSSKFWFSRILERYDAVSLDSLSEFALESIVAQTQGLYQFLIYSTIFLVIVLLILSALLKSIIWALTAKSKISLKYILKFTLAKLVWNLLIIAVIALGFVLFQPQAAFALFAIAAIIWIYFSSVINPLLAKNPKIPEISRGIKLGIKKIHYLILPYLFIIIGIFLIRMLYLAGRTQELLIASGILLLFYLAAGRHYIFEMISKIEK